ncbi:MAG TPA: Rrf2 family transcriptional regulator [Longimicrobiales bacterium]
MAISSRFAVAVHVLVLLERGGGEPVPSERIAASVGTNPAVIRRILCMLSRAGLTRSRLGTGGGAMLARAAREVTLLDVYRAVEDGELFVLHAGDERCPVGRHIEGVLEEAVGAARRAMEEALAKRTLADVCSRVRARCGERGVAVPGEV